MAEQSALRVRVYTSRAQLPVAGATVAVTRPSGGKTQQLLALWETGESGLTPVLRLPAPPEWESRVPGAPRPFTSCDVWVEHPAFQLVHIEGVQLFPGVTTLQEVELLPLAEQPAPEATRAEMVEITPQPL